MRTLFTSAAAITLLSAVCIAGTPSPKLTGLWDGTIQFDEAKIAFPVEFSGSGSAIKASFFNGEERVTSTGGRLEGNSLLLNFDHYATRLDATIENGVLKGKYGSTRYGFHDIEARPHQETRGADSNAPNIAGLWSIPNESPKGEHAWRFIVRQSGTKASAAILRVDGDTGLLTGDYREGKFLLNHFDGARASVLEVVPQENGTLELNFKGFHNPGKKFTAVRAEEAKIKGLPEPADFTAHTRVKDPNEPFQFSFPDLDGKLVSNTDPKFKDKVVIVNITGSWCPNCHDEAPFLAELYRRYRSLGLEIVALDFEEPEQRKDPARLRAFIKQYGIQYSYLIAGEPSELTAKIPQAENLNSWPTTFILGRDGKVRAIHAGFAAPASGEFHTQLKAEFAETLEKLLSENVKASR